MLKRHAQGSPLKHKPSKKLKHMLQKKQRHGFRYKGRDSAGFSQQGGHPQKQQGPAKEPLQPKPVQTARPSSQQNPSRQAFSSQDTVSQVSQILRIRGHAGIDDDMKAKRVALQLLKGGKSLEQIADEFITRKHRSQSISQPKQ